MAKRPREILVPYLQSLCSCHILEHKLKSEYDEKLTQLRNCEAILNKKLKLPAKPPLNSPTEGSGCAIFVAVLMTALTLMLIIAESVLARENALNDAGSILAGFTVFALVITLGLWIYVAYCISGVREENQAKQEKHIIDCAVEERRYKREMEYANASIADFRKEFTVVEKQLAEVRHLLEELYDSNLIPSQYRNIYAIMYLYDWFRSSMADDLEQALSMFVLEEIRERVDVVIKNQGNMILNQQLMISNQYKSMEERRKLNEEMIQRLDAIQATEEEHLRYLDMIESNTEATAYFASADYIQKMFK